MHASKISLPSSYFITNYQSIIIILLFISGCPDVANAFKTNIRISNLLKITDLVLSEKSVLAVRNCSEDLIYSTKDNPFIISINITNNSISIKREIKLYKESPSPKSKYICEKNSSKTKNLEKTILCQNTSEIHLKEGFGFVSCSGKDFFVYYIIN